jgi:MinD-like ATPase involved in chromosome partitioning or flagellar assembly
MGAAAVAGRLTLGRRPRPATGREAPEGLAFHTPGGPLVAVCGLVGGAGASTLAYLLARRAARHSSAPVLLTELQERGALAALAGAAAPLALRELADAVEQQREPERAFADLAGGLRLVASDRAGPTEPVAAAALARLLADARDAHGLVVIDAGPPGGPDHDTLVDAATHSLFVLPATAAAVRQVALLAPGGVFDGSAARRSALVAVATYPGPRAAVKQLRRLAEPHLERLLLVPHVPELAAGKHHQAEPRLEHTFAALATLLRRPW